MDGYRPAYLPRYRIERRPDDAAPIILAFADDLRAAQRALERIRRIGRRGPYRGDLVVVDLVTEAVVASLPTGRQENVDGS